MTGLKEDCFKQACFYFPDFCNIGPALTPVIMNKETARYIIIIFPNLLTANEKIALRHARSLEKLGDADVENSSYANFFRRNGSLTDDPAVLDLLKDGYDVFEQRVCDRIMAECPEKVFLNHCPRCQRLSRTPYARQCRHCGHDWHNIIAAKFILNSSVSITGRGFYILGLITEGEVKNGQFLDLTMLGLATKPQINSIEYSITDVSRQPKSYTALGTDELSLEEMNYLRSHGSFGTAQDILNER